MAAAAAAATRQPTPQAIPGGVSAPLARSLPTRSAGNGLPIGSRIVGRTFGEVTVLRMAAALEVELGKGRQRPPGPAVRVGS